METRSQPRPQIYPVVQVPQTGKAVKADLDGRIACILKGDQTEVGLESTVVDCTGKTLVVLQGRCRHA